MTRKKDASLKGECAKFRWSLAIARSVCSSAIALLCLLGCFVGPKFFSCVFRGSEVFICGHFVVPKFFLVGFQLLDFQILGFWNFQFFGCMRKSDRKQKYINTSQTKYSISNRFMQLLVLFILERYRAFICANGIFSQLFSSVLHQFTRNSNTWLLQNYVLYFFIDYSNFLIAYSPYSPPGK